MKVHNKGKIHVVYGRVGTGVLSDAGQNDEAKSSYLQCRLVCVKGTVLVKALSKRLSLSPSYITDLLCQAL